MRKTYKYRIFLKSSQKTILNKQFDLCTWIYNESLALKKRSWEEKRENLSLYDLNKKIKEWKKEKPELKDVYSQVFQKTQERIDLAFKAFFRRCKSGENPGYPRFKGKNQLKSICYKQGGWKFNEVSKMLSLCKVGEVQVNYHRPIDGKIKTISIIRHHTGKFYVCFSVEIDKNTIEIPKTGKIVGADLGCKTLITLSDGNKILNPKFLKQEEKELSKHQSKRDKYKYDENWILYNKYKQTTRRIHERIINKRINFAYQTANFLVKSYDRIFFEDLDLEGMKGFACKNKSINDSAWKSLIQKTKFKAESAGKTVVLINPCNTSKTCSRCGTIYKDFDNSKEFMDCSCGNYMQRDENASLNILRLGLQSLAKA